MFQRAGMILEGGVVVGLRGVPGVTGFGEQGGVGQAPGDNLGAHGCVAG